MKKTLLLALLFLVSNFSYSQWNKWEDKSQISAYLSQARQHARNSNSYIHVSQNPYGLIINPSYTDLVRIDLPEYVKEIQKAILCVNKALLIEPNNQNAKKLSAEINMKAALQMYKMGEDSYEDKQDVYFNRALEFLANAYVS